MEHLFRLDWAGLFLPKMSVMEILVRGLLTYLCLCVLLRIIPKRQVGKGSISDLLFVVLIAGIAVDAIAKQAETLLDFFFVLLTVMLVSFAFDWLAFRSRWFRWFLQEPPTCLIRDGRVLRENLRREMLSEEDLMERLRRLDIDDPREVKEAQLEADGEISVLKKRPGDVPARPATAPREENGGPESEAAPGAADDPTTIAPLPLNGCQRDGDLPQTGGTGHTGKCAGAAQDDEGEPELREFLAAAQRLRARLDWHEHQVVRFREALTRHGVRPKPRAAAVRKVPQDEH